MGCLPTRIQDCPTPAESSSVMGDYETGGLGLGLEYTLTLKLELDSAFRR